VDDNKFFKFLWRINAVLVMCTCLLLFGKFTYEKLYWRSGLPPSVTSNIETHGVDEKGETVVLEKWRYGDLQRVVGAPEFIVPFYSIWNVDEPSRHQRSLRNLLFVDADLKDSRWLLPDNQTHISSYDLLMSEDWDSVLAIVCVLDNSIYLSRPDGRELTQVIADSDRRIGHATIDDNYLVVFYLKDSVAYSAKIALSDFSIVETIALPPVE